MNLPTSDERAQLVLQGQAARDGIEREKQREAAEKAAAKREAEAKRILNLKISICSALDIAVRTACVAEKQSADIYAGDAGGNDDWLKLFAVELQQENPEYSFAVEKRSATRQSYRDTKGGEDYEVEDYTVTELRLIATWS